MYKKIALCGNIGVGKTTLRNKLVSTIKTSEAIGLRASEDYTDFHWFKKYAFEFLQEWSKKGNVYNRHTYPMIMKFLESRLNRETACTDPYKTYIIDRSLYEDRFIFAQSYMDSNLLTEKEFSTYCQFFDKLIGSVPKPDIIVHLEASVDTLIERINIADADKYSILNENIVNEQPEESEFNNFLYRPMVDRSGLETLEVNYKTHFTNFIEEMQIPVIRCNTDGLNDQDVFHKIYRELYYSDEATQKGSQ